MLSVTISGSGNTRMELQPFLIGSGPDLTKQIWDVSASGKPHVGAWKCKYSDSYGEATIVGGPLGPGSKLYFDPPIDDEN